MASGPVEALARSPDELAFLTRLAASPKDDLVRLVYADWLEERSDPLGPLLRRFTEAYRGNEPLPPLDDVPQPWAELAGLVATAAIVQSGLAAQGDQLLAHARPALKLEVNEFDFEDRTPAPAEMGTTRLGGDPDLPAGATYPLDVDGQPLHFIGQFDVADFAGTVAGQAFPSAGLLSIFRPQAEWGSCYPSEADMPNLVRLTLPGTPLVRLPRPNVESEGSDQLAPYRPELRIVETLRLPANPAAWAGIEFPEPQFDQFSELFPTCLGGEAYVLLGHVTHGNIGEEPIKDRPDWVQLILVPHFEGPDFGQSDMSLSYHLPAEDLKAGRFDRLEATFG